MPIPIIGFKSSHGGGKIVSETVLFCRGNIKEACDFVAVITALGNVYLFLSLAVESTLQNLYTTVLKYHRLQNDRE